MKENEIARDALGNEMVIGANYGYSRRANGMVTVVVGKLIKINQGANASVTTSVTLNVLHRGGAVYDNNITREKTSNKISPTANSLFRMPDDEELKIGWKEYER